MTGNDVTYRVRYGQFTIVYYAYDSGYGTRVKDTLKWYSMTHSIYTYQNDRYDHLNVPIDTQNFSSQYTFFKEIFILHAWKEKCPFTGILISLKWK